MTAPTIMKTKYTSPSTVKVSATPTCVGVENRLISQTESGEAKRLRKLRDQTSSRKAVVMPCITRAMKSQSRTAPSIAGTKLNFAPETESR